MIRRFLFYLLMILALAVQLSAQGKPKLVDCRNIEVQDSDKRGFDERDSFGIDVDDDGMPDTFKPRSYTVKTNRKISGKTKPKEGEIHWIAFDLKTSKGRVSKSFFKYRYGTDEADYWVYAFVPCKVNNDGKTDLLFYSGDDTSQESVILVNKGNAFKIYSRKVEDLSEL